MRAGSHGRAPWNHFGSKNRNHFGTQNFTNAGSLNFQVVNFWIRQARPEGVPWALKSRSDWDPIWASIESPTGEPDGDPDGGPNGGPDGSLNGGPNDGPDGGPNESQDGRPDGGQITRPGGDSMQIAGEIGARWNIVCALLWSVGGKRWAQPLMRIGTVRVMIGGINFGPNRVRANRRFLPASTWG